METVMKDMKSKMDSSLDALKRGLGKLQTGRASISILDGILVDAYGSQTPLSQLGTLSAPEPSLLTIGPYDVTQLQAIEKAIANAGLGLNPANDGKIIRIPIPSLNEERRKELVKVAKKSGEDCKISIRNARRDANDALKKLEKDKELSEDELKKAQEKVQQETDSEIKAVDVQVGKKESEIMEI